MKKNAPKTTTRAGASKEGRWIRPQKAPLPSGEDCREGSGVSGREIATLLTGEARKRISRLVSMEREIEERIRRRWQDAEARLRQLESRSERERNALRREASAAAVESRIRSEREGRTEGFREGFEKGAEEGRRLGYEQGRLEGLKEGRQAGRREGESRALEAASGALEALRRATRQLGDERDRLLEETRNGLLALALEIARKIVKREVALDPTIVVGNVEKAIEQIFGGCEVILQLHPEDIHAVDSALGGNPRWAEDFDGIEIREAADIEQGGCRLVSGAGVVDLTIESQLELIEEALLQAVVDEEPRDRLPRQREEEA